MISTPGGLNGDPKQKWRPIGFWPGKKVRTKDSLTTATAGEAGVSRGPMDRPSNIGVPSVSKNCGPTSTPYKSISLSPGGMYPSMEKLLDELLPLNGLYLAMLADSTPGSTFSRSWIWRYSANRSAGLYPAS